MQFVERLSALAFEGAGLARLCKEVETSLGRWVPHYQKVRCTPLVAESSGDSLSLEHLFGGDERACDVVRCGAPLLVEETLHDTGTPPQDRGSWGRLLVPVRMQGRCVALIDVLGTRVGDVTTLDRELLAGVARVLAGSHAGRRTAPSWGEATRLLAEPLGHELGIRSVALPVHVSSTYAFDSTDEAEGFLLRPDAGYTYTRWGNPTVRATEQALARLEGSEACALFASGMAAIATTLLTLLKAGDTLLAPYNVYGGTHHLLVDFLPRLGIHTRFVALEDLVQATAEAARLGAVQGVYLEGVSNPTLRLCDVQEVARAAAGRLRVVVDNTIATPLNSRPLQQGADLVIHSATKYLGGHSDLLAGAVFGGGELVEEVRRTGRLLGGTSNPREAALLHRGVKTLGVRMARQATSAAAIARWLEGRPEVVRVWHPSLVHHPEHALAERTLALGVGMVSFDAASPLLARRLLDQLELWHRAVSLGGVESLACLCVLSSHYAVEADMLAHAGVTESTIRLSVGLEEVEDLIADLEQAFLSLHAGAFPPEREV